MHSIASSKCIRIPSTILKTRPYSIRSLITSGCSTKASPCNHKSLEEYLEDSSQKVSKIKDRHSLSKPTETKEDDLCIEGSSQKENISNAKSFLSEPSNIKDDLYKLSEIESGTKRQRPSEIKIREKKSSDKKTCRMSLELTNSYINDYGIYRLYHDNEIMVDEGLDEPQQKLECDNDCPTSHDQIILSIDFLESHLRLAITNSAN